MPIYEYQCTGCDTVFEEWQSGFEEREMACPECGCPANRLISHTSFQLKGSGWYVTDYAGKKPDVPASCADADCKAVSGTADCASPGCKAGGGADRKAGGGPDRKAGGGADCKAGGGDAVPVGKKGAADTPSAGSAS
ncbi:FmdB family zinc ribbon protein [Pseudodesulfovibrio pelocollis]|uniref:FmdB family zinc ribbon protein n=1 Tax=Pseudodesulfovibrio pelocollis TaxID=3051432 RepID=UPI00255A73EE|nr:zinc ribbon domain-containing protein [Pseudodesulfovibrio sp. SB368]